MGAFHRRRLTVVGKGNIAAVTAEGEHANVHQGLVLIIRDAYVLEPQEHLVHRIVDPLGDWVVGDAADNGFPLPEPDAPVSVHERGQTLGQIPDLVGNHPGAVCQLAPQTDGIQQGLHDVLGHGLFIEPQVIDQVSPVIEVVLMLYQAGLPLGDIAEYGNGNILPGAAAGHIAQRLLLRHTQGPVQGCDILLDSPLLKVKHTAEDICAVGNDLHNAVPGFCLLQFPGLHGIALREGAIEVPDADTRRAGYAGQLLQGLALPGIHGADRHSHQQHRPAQSTDPDFWALPPGHITNPPLGVSLTEGQRHTGENTLMGRQPQQGLGIICPDLYPQSF